MGNKVSIIVSASLPHPTSVQDWGALYWGLEISNDKMIKYTDYLRAIKHSNIMKFIRKIQNPWMAKTRYTRGQMYQDERWIQMNPTLLHQNTQVNGEEREDTYPISIHRDLWLLVANDLSSVTRWIKVLGSKKGIIQLNFLMAVKRPNEKKWICPSESLGELSKIKQLLNAPVNIMARGGRCDDKVVMIKL